MIASIILSSIAAVAAILAPVLTAIINNRHNLLIKGSNFHTLKNMKSIKDFLKHMERFSIETIWNLNCFFLLFMKLCCL